MKKEQKELQEMKKYLEELPFEEVDLDVVKIKGYDYFKIPGYRYLLDGSIVHKLGFGNQSILKLALEKLYTLFINLNKKYKKKKSFVKVVILVNASDLFDSQVIIFFEKGVYKEWFERSSNYQTWKKGKKKNELIKKIGLTEYKHLKETHYEETINDKDISNKPIKNNLWFYE